MFLPKRVKIERERYYILTREDDISVLYRYAQHIRATKFVKETLLHIKPQILPHTLLAEAFNSWLSLVYRSSRQKLNTESLELTSI